jgi:hypothetical protein
MGVKAKWQAEGEKSTQYFCNLEKKHQLYQNLSWKINRRSLIQNKSEMNVEKFPVFKLSFNHFTNGILMSFLKNL